MRYRQPMASRPGCPSPTLDPSDSKRGSKAANHHAPWLSSEILEADELSRHWPRRPCLTLLSSVALAAGYLLSRYLLVGLVVVGVGLIQKAPAGTDVVAGPLTLVWEIHHSTTSRCVG